jgi:hypothetical protein
MRLGTDRCTKGVRNVGIYRARRRGVVDAILSFTSKTGGFRWSLRHQGELA